MIRPPVYEEEFIPHSRKNMKFLRHLKLLVPGSLLIIAAVFILQEHFNKFQPDGILSNVNLSNEEMPRLSLNTSLEKYFLVFAIPSDPAHVELRNAIRSTWSNVTSWGNSLSGLENQHKRFKLMFIFGSEHRFNKQLNNELKMHRDDMFFIAGLEDTYKSLKSKVLWAMKEALHSYDFTYFIKTDDDIVVDLPLLINELLLLPRDHYYTGNCYRYYNGHNPDYEKW